LEDKLSSPDIDREEANGSASEAKLSCQQLEHAKMDKLVGCASLREAKLTTPGEKTAAPTEKETAIAREGDENED